MNSSKKPESWAAVIHRALFHGVGSALVAVFSYATASRIPFLHEAYWAPIAAVVVLYPEREATVKAGIQRFLGTAVGSLIGWASAAWWHENIVLYGAAVLLAVGLCYLLRVPDAARLCAVAVTVITIIPRPEPAAVVALDRFLEVSYGVACAIAYKAAADVVSRRARRGRET